MAAQKRLQARTESKAAADERAKELQARQERAALEVAKTATRPTPVRDSSTTPPQEEAAPEVERTFEELGRQLKENGAKRSSKPRLNPARRQVTTLSDSGSDSDDDAY